jgi:hypothetical protein
MKYEMLKAVDPAPLDPKKASVSFKKIPLGSVRCASLVELLLASKVELKSGVRNWRAFRGQRPVDIAPFEVVMRVDESEFDVWVARGDSVALYSYGPAGDHSVIECGECRSNVLQDFFNGALEAFKELDTAFGPDQRPRGQCFADRLSEREKPIFNVAISPTPVAVNVEQPETTLSQKPRTIDILRDKKGRITGAVTRDND